MSDYKVIDAGPALVVGAGLAGLFAALKFKVRPVTILAGSPIGSNASSAWAQGGIAAAMGDDDSPALHVADTIVAGAGIVDEAIARLVTEEAAARIEDLVQMGAPFDRDAQGRLVLGREAAHGRKRIVRVKGDQAGAAIMATLAAAVRAKDDIRVIDGLRATGLIMIDGRARGVWTRDAAGKRVAVVADAILFALGGSGGLFSVTTNPVTARGVGIAMAARAGAVIADPEFVQFHPTALDVGRDPAPLATEALRGEGATLINDAGIRFMLGAHPDAELAPRDIVARGIFREIKAGRRTFLDATKAVGDAFPERFPTVYASCIAAGIDPRIQPIPVAPAAHYHMGGIASDEHGRSAIPGLWVAGECAGTGLHGANRLASNSLLEAIVFGARTAADIDATPQGVRRFDLPEAPVGDAAEDARAMALLRHTMTANVGVERDAASLTAALADIMALRLADHGETVSAAADTALLIAAAAWTRQESRGGHFRSDFPEASDDWKRRTMTTLNAAEVIAAEALLGSVDRAA
ncbi:L-aspartate oxidase [Alphaproteobacteria bacterium SO-S41]|nr:L-aspartate oxidase [Alphaproteobacteria bacterium SO-S41]